MKLTPFRIIIGINAWLLIAATLYGASMRESGGYGSPAAVMNFMLAIWLIPINAILALITGIAYAAGVRRARYTQSWAGAFLFATALILLVNTPACLMLNMV